MNISSLLLSSTAIVVTSLAMVASALAGSFQIPHSTTPGADCQAVGGTYNYATGYCNTPDAALPSETVVAGVITEELVARIPQQTDTTLPELPVELDLI